MPYILRRLLLAPLAALLLSAPLAQAASTGYAVRSDQENALYEINLSTGSASRLGSTGSSNKIEGLAMSAEGELYGMTINGQLLRCDTSTGTCSNAGNLGLPGSVSTIGFAFGADNNLYLAFGTALLQVNRASPTSASYRVINNNLGVALAGLAGGKPTERCASGFYALGANSGGRGKLYCVDLGNGALTQLTDAINPHTLDGGLDANPLTGQLWAITNDSAAAQIYAIDPATFAVYGLRSVLFEGNAIGGFESLAVAPSARGDEAVRVPTLSQWSLAVLGLTLFAFAAFGAIRRKHSLSL